MSQCNNCGESRVTTRMTLTETRLFSSFEDFQNAEQEDIVETDVLSETAPICARCGKPRIEE